MTYALRAFSRRPGDDPGPPSTANDRHQQEPVNLKLARGLSPRATHENPLVMRSSNPGRGCSLGCSSPPCSPETTDQGRWSSLNRSGRPRSEPLMRLNTVGAALVAHPPDLVAGLEQRDQYHALRQ